MATDNCEELELEEPTSCNEYDYEISNGNIKIDVIKITDLSYNEFYWQYLERNQPVVLTNVSNQWECRTHWCRNVGAENITMNKELNDNARPSTTEIDFNYLKNKIGNCQVPVADCNQKYYNSHAKITMDFYDFLNYWQSSKLKEKNYNAEKTETTDLLYLKDWHLKSLLPDYNFYKVPKHFASDWLNEQLLALGRDDYRFVYMGPKGTWTPFHSDVFGSFSWSTNIIGIKKWIFLPPGEEHKLSDTLGNLPFKVDEALLKANEINYIVYEQKENESIFVPSGWYHQVWNITDTISVNHNWFNACNLTKIWLNLASQLKSVVTEISDCHQMDNFIEHCQTMLRATFGLNYLDFIELLEVITRRRLHHANGNQQEQQSTAPNFKKSSTPSSLTTSSSSEEESSKLIFFDCYTPNLYHLKHDLHRIYQVLGLMLSDTHIINNTSNLYTKCLQLRELISTIVS